MCGIAGIFLSGENSLNIDPQVIISMSDLMQHRGPDDYGYYISDNEGRHVSGHLTSRDISGLGEDWNIVFGHRRLSIIDLSESGRQPMSDEQGTLWITFNGEIYNYIELREKLIKKGYKFKSGTDTEVIIHSYREWGQGCVKKFNGMWAFAIWDGEKNELFCSRDRFGIKPFYYFYNEGTFIFASEIKAILKATGEVPQPDTDTINEYIVEGMLCHGEKTFFKNILRLPPATNLIIDSRGKIKLKKFWRYNSTLKKNSGKRNEDRFLELFKDSVKLRLRSDVQNGITLSGGLDSSSIAAMCSELNGDDIHTYSAVFPGYHLDESSYISLITEKFNLKSVLIYPRPDDFIEELRKMIWHMDYPTLSRPAFSYFEIMKDIGRSDSKVILEGQGADEQLAGYVHKYTHLYIADIFRDRELSVSDKISKIFKTVKNTYKTSGFKPFFVSLGKIFPFLHALFKRIIGIEGVLGTSGTREREEQNEDEHIKSGSELMTRLYKDHSRENLPYLLKYGDALSMANSVESRLPFLDYRIVEFVFSLPYSEIMDEGSSKNILRNSLGHLLPEKIAGRSKIGFATPVGEWLNKNINNLVNSVLLSEKAKSRNLYDQQKIRRLIRIQRSGIVDVSNYLFRLISLELWFQIFIDPGEETA